MESGFIKLSQGAEAIVYRKENYVLKQRQRKSYRIKQLDDQLTHSRLIKEAKMMARVPVKTPQLYIVDTLNCTLIMEYVDAKMVKEVVTEENMTEIGTLIGRDLTLMHAENCVHGDLTTSNILYRNQELIWIDFGLSQICTQIEEKAVDLYVLTRAIESTHPLISEQFCNLILSNYGDQQVLKRLEMVKLRGRKREMIG